MNSQRVSSIPQSLPAMPSRRHILRGLAAIGLGLGATRFPVPVAARKKHKRNTQKGDVNTLCKTQIEPCIRLQLPACGDGPACKLALQRCCQFFGTCDFAGFTTCLIDASH